MTKKNWRASHRSDAQSDRDYRRVQTEFTPAFVENGDTMKPTTWVKGGFATPAALLERLRIVVAGAGTQDAAAKQLGISGAYLCDVLKGRREPGKKLLDAMGYRRVVVYEQVR